MKLQALIHRSNNSNLMWTFLQCSLFCLSMCVRRKNSFISNCQSTKHEKFKPRKKTDKFGFTRSKDLSMFIKRSHKTSAKEDRELERTMLLHLQQVKKKSWKTRKFMTLLGLIGELRWRSKNYPENWTQVTVRRNWTQSVCYPGQSQGRQSNIFNELLKTECGLVWKCEALRAAGSERFKLL